MRVRKYRLHPAEDSRVLVMGSGAVKVYTARKTKLRTLSHALAETFWPLFEFVATHSHAVALNLPPLPLRFDERRRTLATNAPNARFPASPLPHPRVHATGSRMAGSSLDCRVRRVAPNPALEGGAYRQWPPGCDAAVARRCGGPCRRLAEKYQEFP